MPFSCSSRREYREPRRNRTGRNTVTTRSGGSTDFLRPGRRARRPQAARLAPRGLARCPGSADVELDIDLERRGAALAAEIDADEILSDLDIFADDGESESRCSRGQEVRAVAAARSCASTICSRSLAMLALFSGRPKRNPMIDIMPSRRWCEGSCGART